MKFSWIVRDLSGRGKAMLGPEAGGGNGGSEHGRGRGSGAHLPVKHVPRALDKHPAARGSPYSGDTRLPFVLPALGQCSCCRHRALPGPVRSYSHLRALHHVPGRGHPPDLSHPDAGKSPGRLLRFWNKQQETSWFENPSAARVAFSISVANTKNPQQCGPRSYCCLNDLLCFHSEDPNCSW